MMEPTKILIYCAKAEPYLIKGAREFVLRNHNQIDAFTPPNLNGLVCFECECKEAFKYDFVHRSGDSSNFYIRDQRTEKMKDCLSNDDLFDYGEGKDLYALHFENVKPIEKPFPITKLYKDEACTRHLKRAPQSYCFAYIDHKWAGHIPEKVLVFSIQSQWCCKYGNGEKDLEIRKTRIMHAGIEYK